MYFISLPKVKVSRRRRLRRSRRPLDRILWQRGWQTTAVLGLKQSHPRRAHAHAVEVNGEHGLLLGLCFHAQAHVNVSADEVHVAELQAHSALCPRRWEDRYADGSRVSACKTESRVSLCLVVISVYLIENLGSLK